MNLPQWHTVLIVIILLGATFVVLWCLREIWDYWHHGCQ